MSFRVRVPAWFYLGAWFQYQLIEADVGLYSAAAHRGGVAFFVHVGGFSLVWVVSGLLP